MIGKLFKYIFGFVVFTAKGGFSERFINLCAVKRIGLWDVSLYDNTITGKIRIGDFRKLRGVARKTGVRIRIISRIGLPFYLRKHRSRVGLIVGGCIFIFFMTVMNSFVWCIQTQSSDKFSREQILKAAEYAGLHYGIRVKNFDEEKAAREIYKTFDGELSWVKVNIKGSLAVIDFRDKVKKLETEEKGEPSNIIADFDGVILSDETYQGSKNKSKGDTVRKGEVLISGVVEGIDMKPLYYEAKGKFTALHSRTLSYTLKADDMFYKLNNTEYHCHFSLFGADIPLSFPSNSAETENQMCCENYLEFDGYELPFGIKKAVGVNHIICEIADRERELLTVLYFAESEYKEMENTNILSRQLEMKKEKGSLTVLAEYNCIDFIGESKVIFIENSEIS